MEDARIRAFSRLLGSNYRTVALSILTSASLLAGAGTAQATPECQNLAAGDPMTAGNDTCTLTSASPQSTPVDALGQVATTGADILKFDDATPFSFALGKIGLTGDPGVIFSNFESVEITSQSTIQFSGTNTGPAVAFANHGFVYGNFTLNGNLSNDGKISPGTAAGLVGSIDISGNYASGTTVGRAIMDVDLHVANNPGVSSDLIHVGGNVAGGTLIQVNQINSGAPIKTTGDGILLWKIEGTTSAFPFGLENPVVDAGSPYQYVLNFVPNYSGTSDGVFLQSALREEFYGNAALLGAGQAAIRACFRSDQRIPDAPHARDSVRMWVGGETASFKAGADSGVQFDDKMTCANGGLDLGIGEGLRFGLVGGFGSSSVDVITPGGRGSLDGTTTALEALISIGTPQYFFNVTGGYATTDWTFDGPVQASKDATQSGLIGSAQAGATINVTPFRFKFIGAVNYDHTHCGDNCLLAGMTEETGILEGKGTIRIEAMTHQINPYVAVSFSTDISGDNTASMGGESLTSNPGHSLLALNAGFNAPIDEGVLLFGDFAVLDGMGNDTSGYSASGGFKAFW